MVRPLLVLLPLLAVCHGTHAQTRTTATADSALAAILSFEVEQTGPVPTGWSGGPAGTLFVDTTVTHGGKSAARIERTATSADKGSALTKSLPLDFKGSLIELRGFIRTENVTDFADLWLRLDGVDGALASTKMDARKLRGTTEWTEHAVTLPIPPAARSVQFGFFVAGAGKGWVDDLRLLVDGKPVWEAPDADPARLTVLDRDQEFAAGSRVAVRELRPEQVAHLALLAKVWGFLKYHHPKVTAGELHWDYALFREIPRILAAPDRAAVQAALVEWVAALGKVVPPTAARTEPRAAHLYLRPDLAWLQDEAALGRELSTQLLSVHAARPDRSPQFYVSLTPWVWNPIFEHELSYPRMPRADAGYQLLALFRFWNIVRYWAPYRDLTGEDWDAVLQEFIPRIALARDVVAYRRELLALVVRMKDGHTDLRTFPDVRPPVGAAQVPAAVRFIEGRPVVVEVAPVTGEAAPALRRGDVLLAIAGRPVAELITEWSPFYAASHESARLHGIAHGMLRGPAGTVRLRVQRGEQSLEVEATRVESKMPRIVPHDLPGPTFRLLSKDIAYLKLSEVKVADVAGYLEKAAGTKGWIIDIRNYPSEFVVFALGNHFVERLTPFARFTTGDMGNPGAFTFEWAGTASLQPAAPHYGGRIIVLVDEDSISQSEYTAMAFRAVPGALVVGSTTAAADGNVSRIPLPGGLSTGISGIGVFYPDKRPTQRIGIVADVAAKPTLAGIDAGRDEVLEEAVRQILGPQASQEQIEQMVPRRD